jgi:tetratricopeptide (TPR) repeat protein
VSGGSRRGQTLRPSVDDLLLRAAKAHQRGDLATAESACRQVLADDAADARAVQILGAILAERGDVASAVDLFEPAAERLGPPTNDSFGFYNNYANALRLTKRNEEAEAVLRQLVSVAPREWQPWHNLGQVLKDLHRYDEAVAALRRAVALAPEYGPNHGVLGEVLNRLGRLRSAGASLRKCIDLGWDTDVNLWSILGNNHRMLGELSEAIECLERALVLGEGSSNAHSNLGIVFAQAGQFDAALSHFRTSIEMDPETSLLHSNAAYGLLTAGEIVEGWREWEWGAVHGGPRGEERRTEVPRWTPARAPGRVLCYREQGVGDELLFASCYPDLLASASDVVIECDKRLVSLFARSFPSAEVRAQSIDPLNRETMHDFAFAIPAGSLPQLFRSSLDAFPERGAFIVADPVRVQAWRARLAQAGPGPYVGMSWRSKLQTAERRLEYSRLDEWEPILSIPGITFVNLQYDDCERELRAAEHKFGVTLHRWDWLDLMNDFEEMAALSCALDLVVAARNAVAMLGGAAGTPTVMMGNRWDWSDLGTDTCPWFPTIQLVYRHLGEEWDDVIATAATSVRELATTVRPLTTTGHTGTDREGS